MFEETLKRLVNGKHLSFKTSAHPGLAARASVCRAYGAWFCAGYRVCVPKLQHEPYRQSWL